LIFDIFTEGLIPKLRRNVHDSEKSSARRAMVAMDAQKVMGIMFDRL